MSVITPDSTTEHPRKAAGEVLRAIREGAGMSLRAMVWRVGCSHAHLARVEYGERALTRDMGHRISRAIADRILEKRAA